MFNNSFLYESLQKFYLKCIGRDSAAKFHRKTKVFSKFLKVLKP
jgi:hypothetical protein